MLTAITTQDRLIEMFSFDGQVSWFNVTIGRQRRHVYPSDKTEARRMGVLHRCSASVESSTYWDPLYCEHWTIQAASQDVSL